MVGKGIDRCPAAAALPHIIESKILLQEIRDCLEAHAAGPNLARDCAIFWLYYAQGYTAKAHRSASVNQAFSEGVESTIHVLYAKG